MSTYTYNIDVCTYMYIYTLSYKERVPEAKLLNPGICEYPPPPPPLVVTSFRPAPSEDLFFEFLLERQHVRRRIHVS